MDAKSKPLVCMAFKVSPQKDQVKKKEKSMQKGQVQLNLSTELQSIYVFMLYPQTLISLISLFFNLLMQ